MSKVLVIRSSSFGDVALLVPVVFSVASRYPQVRFEVMTRQAYSPLFNHLGFNISVLPIDAGGRHKGVLGLFRIIGNTVGEGFTHIADVHDVLRSKVVRFIHHLLFSKVRKIDKGRAEKRLMTQNKDTGHFLKHTTQRYLDVFERLGFETEISFENLFDFKPRTFDYLSKVTGNKMGSWIGIAPFARHKGKIYPLDKMEELISMLSERKNTSIFIFGLNNGESAIRKEWEQKYPNIVNIDGLLGLEQELVLISYLDVMLSMDSANMHLASLVQVPVVSVWGATHPALGFYGFGQDIDNAVQLEMDCRPCSIYGDTPCIFHGKDEYKCMKQIEPRKILDKIEKVLETK